MQTRKIGKDFRIENYDDRVVVTYRSNHPILFNAFFLPSKNDFRKFQARIMRIRELDIDRLYGMTKGKNITCSPHYKRIIF